MEIKAVFFDIDGTLINDSRTVLKSTEAAIKSLQEQGILVGLATGRQTCDPPSEGCGVYG